MRLRIRTRRCAALLLGLSLTACRIGVSSEPLERPAAPPPGAALDLMRLGPNDILRARVHGHPELSTPESNLLTGTRIDPDGTLALPLVGGVQVGGMTLPEARTAIRAAYSAYMKDPEIEVSVVEYAARRFYLFGEVRTPGPVALDRPLNAYQALSFGGGVAPFANRKKIVLLREVDDAVQVHIIDGEQPDESGLIWLQPDDFIFVQRTGVGKFSEQALPILTAISSTLSSVTTLILIDERLDG